jgi:hypothetical protein
MGLNFAVDELYAAGWSALDSSGCSHAPDGRAYPNAHRVKREFAQGGCDLTIRYVQLFDCYRAEWKDTTGQASGAVVGASEEEAAVYAMAHFLRQTART